jgi:hypothetical protein
MHWKKVFSVVALLCAGNPVFSQEGASLPKMEIRQYRFNHHGKHIERLVLEFDLKEGAAGTPKVQVTQKSPKEVFINSENLLLLGAIPESLINESYARKSHILGPIAVNLETQQGGFSLQANLKKNGTVKAFWLANPTRLVMDVAATEKETAHNESESNSAFTHGVEKAPLSAFLCFPAAAKVNLNVIFESKMAAKESVQNIPVNLEPDLAAAAAAAEGGVVCYPKKAQVHASLTFSGLEKALVNATNPQLKKTEIAPRNWTPAAIIEKQAAAAPNTDDDLDPLPLPQENKSFGGLPALGGSRSTATETPAPASAPTSLLPPLRMDK